MNVDETLETAAADCFWVPEHVEVIERDAIKYTRSSRPGLDYNRVLRVRPDLADPAELVEEVRQAHRGGASRWMLNAMSDGPAIRQALKSAGYEAGSPYLAYSVATRGYLRRGPEDVEVRQAQTIDDLRTLYEINSDAFDRELDFSDERLARELADCTGPDRRVGRFIAFRNGEPAGSGGMTFFEDLSFSLIWAGGVRKVHRGHGVYTALLAARAAAAVGHGIERMGLYAKEDTSAPIVAAHGFDRHGHMVYFDSPEVQL
ncbi:MAG: GNAT family N-acetyltransferase [Persicimonas sp.]